MPGLGIWDRVSPRVNVSDIGLSLGGLNEKAQGDMGILPVKANILLGEWYPPAGGGWRVGPWDGVHIQRTVRKIHQSICFMAQE